MSAEHLGGWALIVGGLGVGIWLVEEWRTARRKHHTKRNRMDPYRIRWAPAVHDNEQRKST